MPKSKKIQNWTKENPTMVKKVNELGISWIVNLITMGEGSSEFFFTPALEKYHDVYQIKSNIYCTKIRIYTI